MLFAGNHCTDGRPPGEISRRLREAGYIFELLAAARKHANITRQRKLQIFEACVVSKLLYGLLYGCCKKTRTSLMGFTRNVSGVSWEYNHPSYPECRTWLLLRASCFNVSS